MANPRGMTAQAHRNGEALPVGTTLLGGPGRRLTPTAGLASIIIPVHNGVDLTSACLDSVRRHTDGDFETIVVDDASDDATSGMLAARDDLRVLTHLRNHGFAAAVNRGIRDAAGEYLVVLNNDTLVTPGWLARLIRHAQTPGVGLVGTVSNYAADYQLNADLTYRTVDELDRAALRLASALDGQRLLVPKITGLCALIKRAVIERIGGFDPRFGLGYCEDDDFCIRAGLAGFKIAVARDVFIHHEGSRTFTAGGDDPEVRMQANWRVFKAKWELEFPEPSDIHTELGRAYEILLGRPHRASDLFDGSYLA